ncbi:hypothetical protein MUK42_19446 [Musa troglodytarum]|uniref:Uncharacterized protein n=1 Tax=Musa troglodytarum TaxID=320322 RepID=A0A9E7G3R2_9LILI|nr:hypothetical protein MUK42_19446 [Musa troglodytarum]
MSSVSRAKSCPSSSCRVQYLLIWRLVGLQWRIDHRTQKNPQEQGTYAFDLRNFGLTCLLALFACTCNLCLLHLEIDEQKPGKNSPAGS